MSQCSRCGKKGFFLKVNSIGICESCEQEEKNTEQKIRANANLDVQALHSTVISMQDMVNSLVEIHESGSYSKENVEAAIQMLNISVEKLKEALDAVKNAPVNEVQEEIDISKCIIQSFNGKIAKIMSNPAAGDNALSYRRHYHVAGTSFRNEDGTARQGILRRIKFAVPEYVCPVVTVKQYSYQGEPAVAVYANEIQIGNIAKEDIATILSNTDELIDSNIVVFGGDSPDKNCGAEIILTYKK